jgi:hypothetical protein
MRLTASGHQYTQPLVIKADPRVQMPAADYERQYGIAQKLVDALQQNYAALQQVRSLRAQLKDLKPRAQGAIADAITKLDQDAARLEGGGGGFGAALSGPQAQSMTRLNGSLAHVYDVVGAADAAPTTQAVATANQLQQSLSATLSRWDEVKVGIGALNQQLQGAGLPAIDLNRPAPARAEESGEGDEP